MVFCNFFDPRQGAKHCDLQCFYKFRLENKCMEKWKNRIATDVFEGACEQNTVKIAFFEKHCKYNDFEHLLCKKNIGKVVGPL